MRLERLGFCFVLCITTGGGAVAQDSVVFETNGSSFSAILTVNGEALIEWTFDDGSTSDSARPSKDYGSAGVRENRLKVSPWSALTGINIGYDGGDGGPNTIEYLEQQNVTAVTGLANVAPYLQIWCSSHNPLTSLDFSNFVSLTEIECFLCQSLTSVNLHHTPALSRACFEDNDLAALDLSESPALADLRGAVNAYTSITWGTTGAQVWHICVRDNPQMTSNLPEMSQFPLLQELFVWNDNQTGVLHPTSTHLTSVLASGNHYTEADFTGTFPAGRGGGIDISNNDLTVLILADCPGLTSLQAQNNALDRAAVDNVLATLDSFATSGGALNLLGNASPSDTGRTHGENLTARGWTVSHEGSGIDTTPPVIEDVLVETSSGTASILWQTNEIATTTIEYGTTRAFENSYSSPQLSLSHFAPLEGLAANTMYYFRLRALDAHDNATVSAEYMFATSLSDSVYWEDNFHRADGDPGNGWTGVNEAAAEIQSNALRRTDSGAYRIYYNPAGSNLPADYYLTMTVPYQTTQRAWWGVVGRYLPPGDGMGSGNKVFWMDQGVLHAGVGHADFSNDITLFETGGYPPSWTEYRIHTVTIGYAEDKVTIYLDGQEFGYFIDDTNNQTGTGIGIVGDGGGSDYFVYDIKATNYLPVYTNAVPASAEGEGQETDYHAADQNRDYRISLTELLRVIQFFNLRGYSCAVPPNTTEDGYLPGSSTEQSCVPHSSDYNPQNWQISLSELLRLIQFFNLRGYHACPELVTEDGYCPGE